MDTQTKPKVIVGIDGSAISRDALAFAIREAGLRGATLVAVMSIELPDYSWIDPYALNRRNETDYVGAAEAKLHSVLEAAGVEGLDVEPVVTTTPAPAALVGRSEDADLLVVGSHGRGGFRGLVMGSVSLQCVLHAHCPITVVRPAPEHAPAGHTVEDTRRDTAAAFRTPTVGTAGPIEPRTP